MIKNIISAIGISLSFSVMSTYAQDQNMAQAEDYSWIESLNEEGISIVNDSVHFSAEILKISEDSVYRLIVYPKEYEWTGVVAFIAEKELKKAFWHMINLYPQSNLNKELVVKSVVSYNALFDMNKVMTNTFYTYCYLDPAVSNIVNGKPEMHSPHILDEKLAVLKEILFYLDKYKGESEKIFTKEQTE